MLTMLLYQLHPSVRITEYHKLVIQTTNKLLELHAQLKIAVSNIK